MSKNKQDEVIAIFCSDLHLSATPPAYRSAEPDWFEAMLRPITELKQLQEKHGCPIFCAGDLFDKWYGGPKEHSCELINWAMTHLPYMHCIPGQHDLPDHDLSQIERSAYWTLVQSKAITDLPGVNGFTSDKWPGLCIRAFPFGETIRPGKNLTGGDICIAIIHQYNWVEGHSYTDAPDKGLVSFRRRPEFEGYDLIVSGDNHMPFITLQDKAVFVNCGGFMRRKTDDHFDPCVWFLHKNAEVSRYRLDISKDKYLETAKAQEMEKAPSTDLSGLMKRLEELGACALDFVAAMKLDLETNPARRGVESRITKAME